MVIRVSDASGEAYISTFNEEAGKIIGCSTDDLRSQVSYWIPVFLMFDRESLIMPILSLNLFCFLRRENPCQMKLKQTTWTTRRSKRAG